jgi:hypothetical protein
MTADGSRSVFFTFTFTGSSFLHRPLHHPSLTSDFLAWITGPSVELRYIAVDIIRTGFVTNTNVNYSIDAVPYGTAFRDPQNRNSYVYNQSLFNVTGLTNAEHTLWVDLLPPSVLLV